VTEPTLGNVFPGATQTVTAVTIPKTALPTLTARSVNSGDQIAAGLLLALLRFYTPSRRVADSDVSLVVQELVPAIDTFTTPPQLVESLTVLLFRPATIPQLTADAMAGAIAPPPTSPPLVEIEVPANVSGQEIVLAGSFTFTRLRFTVLEGFLYGYLGLFESSGATAFDTNQHPPFLAEAGETVIAWSRSYSNTSLFLTTYSANSQGRIKISFEG